MTLASGTPGNLDGLPQSPTDVPRSRPDVVRGTGIQLGNLSENINRATDAFTKLLSEVSKAVGKYGAVQLENLGQMPIFPEPIRALMGMLTKSPEALASQLNRMIPNHAQTRDLQNGQRGWVDATRDGDRALLTQLGAEIDRVRQTAGGNGPILNRFFAQLTAAIGTNPEVTLADVVAKARTLNFTPAAAPAAPVAPQAAPTVAPNTPEIRELAANEELKVGDKRSVNAKFVDDVTIDGKPGRLAASTNGSVTIDGLKLTRASGEDKITVEVVTGAAVGERKIKFAGETKILKIVPTPA